MFSEEILITIFTALLSGVFGWHAGYYFNTRNLKHDSLKKKLESVNKYINEIENLYNSNHPDKVVNYLNHKNSEIRSWYPHLVDSIDNAMRYAEIHNKGEGRISSRARSVNDIIGDQKILIDNLKEEKNKVISEINKYTLMLKGKND